jgi:Uma2 family endonuclease
MATSEVLEREGEVPEAHVEAGGADDHAGPLALGFVPDPHRVYTAAEVRALNAANPDLTPRYECARGRLLVTPSPADIHQLVIVRLVTALQRYCEAHLPDGVPMLSPSDVSWGRRDTTLQPDVYVALRADLRAVRETTRRRGSVAGWRQLRHLLLAVEVLSPRTAAADRTVKRAIYQAQGVPLYWIVDGEREQVEVWTPDAIEPQVERERLAWHPDGADVACELPLAELFRPL